MPKHAPDYGGLAKAAARIAAAEETDRQGGCLAFGDAVDGCLACGDAVDGDDDYCSFECAEFS